MKLKMVFMALVKFMVRMKVNNDFLIKVQRYPFNSGLHSGATPHVTPINAGFSIIFSHDLTLFIEYACFSSAEYVLRLIFIVSIMIRYYIDRYACTKCNMDIFFDVEK